MPGMTRARWLLLGSLYTTQYLGIAFLLVGLVAILRQHGANLDRVGMVYALGMIWPLKFLWAPLVDRIRFGRWGHYRIWLLVMQGGLVVSLVALATLRASEDFAAVYLLCVCVSVLSATQDVAADGLACRLLTPTERGPGNGIQLAGGLLGHMLGGGVVLMIYPFVGWTGAVLLLAAATSVSFVQLLFFREPADLSVPARRGGLIGCVVSFWRRPGGRFWLLLLMLFPLGSSLAYSMTTPILVDLGWGMDRIGLAFTVFGSLAGMAAALATGKLLQRFGRRAMLIACAAVQVPGVAVIAVPVLGLGDGWVTAAVILYFLCYTPVATVLATLMMDQASPHRPATEYTFQFSLNMLFSMAAMSGGAGSTGGSGAAAGGSSGAGAWMMSGTSETGWAAITSVVAGPPRRVAACSTRRINSSRLNGLIR